MAYANKGKNTSTKPSPEQTYMDSEDSFATDMRGGNKSPADNASKMGNPRSKLPVKQKIFIHAKCKTCARFSSRSLVSSALYEYSKARFFEQFFYNDKLRVKEGIFGCDHGVHPLRDYIIEFSVDSCKIQFRYTPIDTYSI